MFLPVKRSISDLQAKQIKKWTKCWLIKQSVINKRQRMHCEWFLCLMLLKGRWIVWLTLWFFVTDFAVWREFVPAWTVSEFREMFGGAKVRRSAISIHDHGHVLFPRHHSDDHVCLPVPCHIYRYVNFTKNIPGHNPMVTFPWSQSHGHISMVTFPWSHFHGHISMVTFPWSHFHGHISMVTFPWSHFHGHIPVVTFLWSHFHGHNPVVTIPWSQFHGHNPMVTIPWSHFHGHNPVAIFPFLLCWKKSFFTKWCSFLD